MIQDIMKDRKTKKKREKSFIFRQIGNKGKRKLFGVKEEKKM